MGNTVGYYGMLHAELERIQGILQDSALARNLNRENIIQDAKNRAATYNQLASGAMNMMGNALQSAWGNFQGGPQQGGGGYSHQQGGHFGGGGFGGGGQFQGGSTFGTPQNPYGGNPYGNNPYGNQGGYGGNQGGGYGWGR